MKSKILPSFVAAAFFGCFAVNFAAAQSPPVAAPVTPAAPGVPPVPAASTSVSMKLDLVSWGPDIPGLTVKSGSKSSSVTALGFRYSKAINYSGPNVIEIYQTPGATLGPLLDENGKELTRKQIRESAEAAPAAVEKQRKDKPGLVALAVLPSNSRRATVLLAPTKGGLFRAWVIDDDPSKLPLGKLRVHNYAPMRIAMNFNNGKIAKEMKTNDSFVVNPENNQIIYELAYQKAGAWQVQENNMLSVPSDEQAQMIVLQSTDDFFVSSSGSRGGFLQAIVLRRGKDAPEEQATP